jgi:hypothetical protein
MQEDFYEDEGEEAVPETIPVVEIILASNPP